MFGGLSAFNMASLQGWLGLLWFFFFFFFFVFSRAIPAACGGSQARGRIRAIAAGLRQSPQQHGIPAASAAYPTAHGNAGSLTHGARPGIELASSWFLVRFVNHYAMTGTSRLYFITDRKPLGLLTNSQLKPVCIAQSGCGIYEARTQAGCSIQCIHGSFVF